MEVATRDAELKTLSPAAVRDILLSNGLVDAEDKISFTGEVLLLLDPHLAETLFLVENRLLNREELISLHPFERLGQQPEDVTDALEVAVFSNGESVHRITPREGEDAPPPRLPSSLVCRRREAPEPELVKIVPTKVRVASERWEDFRLLCRTGRALVHLVPPEALKRGLAHALTGDSRLALEAPKPESAPEPSPESALPDRECLSCKELKTRVEALERAVRELQNSAHARQ